MIKMLDLHCKLNKMRFLLAPLSPLLLVLLLLVVLAVVVLLHGKLNGGNLAFVEMYFCMGSNESC